MYMAKYFGNDQSLCITKSLLTNSAMEDTKEPSNAEHTLSPIITEPTSDSAAARQSSLLHLVQTLDRDGLADLEKSIRIEIAGRRRVLNDKISPLLRLPAELIVAIGCHVKRVNRMEGYPSPLPGLRPPRANFRTAIWYFENTCSRLRQVLKMVTPTTVILCYQPVERAHVAEQCKKIRRDLKYYDTLQSRPLSIYMYHPRSRRVSGSRAAAFAASVERAVFGSLQNPPVVYTQTGYDRDKRGNQGTDFFMDVYISHAGELNMRRMKRYPSTRYKEREISADEAKTIWKELDDKVFRRSHRKVSIPSGRPREAHERPTSKSNNHTCAPLCVPD
jgi:hypothetical protein